MTHTFIIENPRCTVESTRPLDGAPRIAILGAHDPAPSILEYVHYLAGEVARVGGIVVGCGERGVETAAHRAAVAANGRTWVLSPAAHRDVLPPEQKRLFDSILRSAGAVVWPSPSDAKTYTSTKRQDVLIQLSDAIVVAQAVTPRSRSVSTATKAINARKRVWVVPPAPWLAGAEGTHALLRLPEAKILWRTSDLLASVKLAKRVVNIRRENPFEQMVVTVLTTPLHADQISDATELTSSHLASALFQLQAEGIVRQRLDGCFELV